LFSIFVSSHSSEYEGRDANSRGIEEDERSADTIEADLRGTSDAKRPQIGLAFASC
jgi:hypothetical protein